MFDFLLFQQEMFARSTLFMNISKDEFKKIIGDTLRKARKRKNISQEKAAEKISAK